MKKLFSAVAVVLTAITCGATETWVRIDSAEILDGYTVYVDQTTLLRSQTMVKMWHLIDFKIVKSIEGKSFLSLRGEEEYDCKEDRHRQLAFTWHSKKMGMGEIVLTGNSPGEWLPVLPGSIGLSLWEFACRNKQRWTRQTERLWRPPTFREFSGVPDLTAPTYVRITTFFTATRVRNDFCEINAACSTSWNSTSQFSESTMLGTQLELEPAWDCVPEKAVRAGEPCVDSRRLLSAYLPPATSSMAPVV